MDRTHPNREELLGIVRALKQSARDASPSEAREMMVRISEIRRRYAQMTGAGIPPTPELQAVQLDPAYRVRDHISLMGAAIADAVRGVENGESRRIAVSVPPRSGKSTLLSLYGPLWLLRKHPEWKIIMAAHDGGLTTQWARSIRLMIEDNPGLGIVLERDGGAGSRWSTVEGGGMYATSVRGGLTGRGARVLIIDDPVRDFVEAHSIGSRENLWNWWLSVALTRLEPPSLVLAVMTRWHEDDFIGRLLSREYEGDPADWQKITLPAIAEEGDVLGREPGDPLYSPMADEDRETALARWNDTKTAVGTYTFSAMYQQRPAPSRGAIFDAAWWRFWTTDPSLASADRRVVLLDPDTLADGKWLDSWDCAFKGEVQHDTGDGWVVGQRWVRKGADRYLIAQQRGRWSFTQTIAAMERWALPDDQFVSPYGQYVHERLIEDRANGTAIIDVLKDRISGLKPINPTSSKESRARAVTPEVESGNVLLPHPSEPGYEWVADLLSELRNFPHDVADDQVDALTQGLSGLRMEGRGIITVPGRARGIGWQQPRNIARTAASDLVKHRGRSS